jgi:hypothetical protein
MLQFNMPTPQTLTAPYAEPDDTERASAKKFIKQCH